MKPLTKAALVALASGVAGYVGETALAGDTRSQVGRKLPFLPAYAAGGAAVSLLEPHLREENVLVRGLAYGATLSAVEFAGCLADRTMSGKEAWNYGEGPLGCTTWKHALVWAGLGLLTEQVVRRI